jgi:formylglycine-generating enzyme required for sulfatase activity
MAEEQPKKSSQVGGVNFTDIQNSQIQTGDIDASVHAGRDIIAGDQIIHYHFYGTAAAAAPAKPPQAYEPEMILIPAGPFIMGNDEGAPHEAPAHPVNLPVYKIGKYPITNAQYLAFVQATGHSVSAKMGWRLARRGKAPTDEMLDHPVVGVSWDDAVAYCAWLREQTGRLYRLPSEAEWEKAAAWSAGQEGQTGRSYPWGDGFEATRCNSGESGLGATSPIGHYSPAGDSGYGCADMAGNVWEWTHTRWGHDYSEPDYRYPYTPDQRENPASSQPHREYRICRGGSYLEERSRLRCSARNREPADEQSKQIGFRVVIELPPDLAAGEEA